MRLSVKYINSRDFLFKDTAVTFGKFDGLHLGHRLLTEDIKRFKNEEVKNGRNITTVLFTFDFSKSDCGFFVDREYIFTMDEKISIVEKLGIDVLIAYPFDRKAADMKPDVFINDIIVSRLGARYIAAGSDFSFGLGAAGNVTLLEESSETSGYKLRVFDKLKLNNEIISSTIIRSKLKNGDVKTSMEMLGQAYFISGKVTEGRRLGHTLGFPTLNLIPDNRKLMVKNGVYATRTFIEDGSKRAYSGMTNVGVRPTVGTQSEKWVETNLFDFNGNLYGKTVRTEFLEFIREEIKFPTIDALRMQLLDDRKRIEDMEQRMVIHI
jgi:riboflavin kinase/FMN adenylyltransferase